MNSPIICPLILQDRLLELGRICPVISGNWGHEQLAGTLSCILSGYLSWTTTSLGASVVTGEIDGMMVHFIVF